LFGRIEIFNLATGLARHASAKQAHVAANMANADTPGYRAQDIKPFSESYNATGVSGGLKSTRSGHVLVGDPASSSHLKIESIDRPSGGSPSGNTVSLETEMLEAIDANRKHNRAVTIYQTSLDILRSSLRSGR